MFYNIPQQHTHSTVHISKQAQTDDQNAMVKDSEKMTILTSGAISRKPFSSCKCKTIIVNKQ